MTTDVKEIQKRIEDVDEEKFDHVLVDTFYNEFDGYEAMKGLFSLVLHAQSATEYDIINNTVIALLGWSIESLLENTIINQVRHEISIRIPIGAHFSVV